MVEIAAVRRAEILLVNRVCPVLISQLLRTVTVPP